MTTVRKGIGQASRFNIHFFYLTINLKHRKRQTNACTHIYFEQCTSEKAALIKSVRSVCIDCWWRCYLGTIFRLKNVWKSRNSGSVVTNHKLDFVWLYLQLCSIWLTNWYLLRPFDKCSLFHCQRYVSLGSRFKFRGVIFGQI